MKDKKSSCVHGSPFCTEVIACLDEAFLLLESGDEDRLNADPYFERGGGLPDLTQADVDRLIAALDEEFNKEIDYHADYHLKRSGATHHTDWHRLTPSQRLGLAQQLCRIVDRYE